ncbi:MAG: hypothetical protein EBQ96_03410 [Proteobacteria bacterium]|nr:hypothetical protein [Pseudomonadota bacterium]
MSQYAANNLTINDRDTIARAGQIKLALAAGCTGLENDPGHAQRLRAHFGTTDVTYQNTLASRLVLARDVTPALAMAASVAYHAWVIHSLFMREWLNHGEMNGFYGSPRIAHDAYTQTLRWEKNAHELATYALERFDYALRYHPDAFDLPLARHNLAHIRDRFARTENMARQGRVMFKDAKPELFSSARFTYLTTAFSFSSKAFALYLDYCDRELGILHAYSKAPDGVKLDPIDVAEHLGKHVKRINDIEDHRAETYQSILLLAQSAGQDPRTVFFGGVSANEPDAGHLRYRQ